MAQIEAEKRQRARQLAREASRRWREKHPDAYHASQKRWRDKDPEATREAARRNMRAYRERQKQQQRSIPVESAGQSQP